MKNIILHLRRISQGKHRGQSIVIVALALVGVITFVGLAVDVGLLFIGYGHLRRATDAASIAAATQYREGWSISDLTNTANEFLALNGVDDGSFTIEVCDEAHKTDLQLCTTPRRKLVRVTGVSQVATAFLPVIGIYGIEIRAEAIGEAASMDVVLVIDVSESMSWDAACGDGDDDDGDGYVDEGAIPTADELYGRPWKNCTGVIDPVNGKPDYYLRNPIDCNDGDITDGIPGECHPFEEVKAAAADFAKWVLDNTNPLYEEDRLAIIVFSNGWEGKYDGASDNMDVDTGLSETFVVGNKWFKSQSEAVSAILDLEIYESEQCSTTEYWTIQKPGTCNLILENGTFGGSVCPFMADNPVTTAIGGDVSTCASTAIGLGLKIGGRMFAVESNPTALWVTVLLTDGAANATEVDVSDENLDDLPWGYCPDPTFNWNSWDWSKDYQPQYCQDLSSTSTHSSSSYQYDADDYARDAARFVACDPTNPAPGCNGIKGQRSLVFTIGLGQEVLKAQHYNSVTGAYELVDLDGTDGHYDQYGDALLRFISEIGDDGDPNSAYQPCSYDNTPRKILTPGNDQYECGNYYYREFGGDLDDVFTDISSRIFTRLSH